MATVEELRLEIKAQVADAVSKLKSFERQTKKTTDETSKMQSTFAKMRDVMQGPVAAFNMIVGGVTKVIGVMDKMIMSAVESEQAMTNLESALEATNANMSLSELNDIAEELSKKTLFDDDQLRQAEAVLLTFQKIGRETFPEVMSVATDMSTLLKRDLQTVIQTLGKALNDPIRGMEQLNKIGVSLSSSQSKLVKDMMAVGNVAGAQNLILSELKSKYEGAAAAAADTATGSYLQLKKAIGEVNEELGKSAALFAKQTGLTDFVNGIADRMSRENIILEVELALKDNKPISADRLQMAIKAIGEQMGDLKKQNENIYGEWSRGSDNQKRKWQELYNERVRLVNLLDIEEKKTKDRRKSDEKAAAEEKRRLEADVEAARIRAENEELALIKIDMQSEKRAEIVAWAEREAQAYRDAAEAKAALDAENSANVTNESAQTMAERNMMADQYVETLKKTNEATKQLSASQEELAMIGKIATEALIGGTMEMAEALGAALITGEEGWKSFAKAGLRAVAAIVEALAKQYAAMATAEFFTPGMQVAAAGHAAAALGLYAAAGLIKAIPMADGGSGIVTKPTLFLAGEKGPEPFAFGGANNKRGMSMGGNVIHVHGSLLTEKALDARIRAAVGAR